MRGLEALKVYPLGKGATERSDTLEPWLMSWQGDKLTPLDSMGYFEEEIIGDNQFCTPYTEDMETALELLLEARLKRTYKTNIVVIPQLMTFLWRRYMGKEADLLFTIPVGMPFWGLEEYEPVIVLFLSIVSCR